MDIEIEIEQEVNVAPQKRKKWLKYFEIDSDCKQNVTVTVMKRTTLKPINDHFHVLRWYVMFLHNHVKIPVITNCLVIIAHTQVIKVKRMEMIKFM